jgi:hypothetical protein
MCEIVQHDWSDKMSRQYQRGYAHVHNCKISRYMGDNVCHMQLSKTIERVYTNSSIVILSSYLSPKHVISNSLERLHLDNNATSNSSPYSANNSQGH